MTVTDEAAPVLVVRRQMAVPRERVFEAWLDSESLAHWMRPGNLTHATVTLDPRVGGGFRIVMEGQPDGCVEHHGEYLAIEPPSLLSFTWISEEHGLQADGRHHRVPRAGRGDRAGPHASALAAEGGRRAPEGVDRHRALARRGPDAGLAEEARTRRKRNGRRCASAVGQPLAKGWLERNAAPKPAEPKLANRHRQQRSANVLPDRHLRFDSATESRFASLLHAGSPFLAEARLQSLLDEARAAGGRRPTSTLLIQRGDLQDLVWGPGRKLATADSRHPCGRALPIA